MQGATDRVVDMVERNLQEGRVLLCKVIGRKSVLRHFNKSSTYVRNSLQPDWHCASEISARSLQFGTSYTRINEVINNANHVRYGVTCGTRAHL